MKQQSLALQSFLLRAAQELLAFPLSGGLSSMMVVMIIGCLVELWWLLEVRLVMLLLSSLAMEQGALAPKVEKTTDRYNLSW